MIIKRVSKRNDEKIDYIKSRIKYNQKSIVKEVIVKFKST